MLASIQPAIPADLHVLVLDNLGPEALQVWVQHGGHQELGEEAPDGLVAPAPHLLVVEQAAAGWNMGGRVSGPV